MIGAKRRPPRTRPSYRRAVEIIAMNFAPDMELDGDMTIGVLATLFDLDAAQIVADVETLRGRMRVWDVTKRERS